MRSLQLIVPAFGSMVILVAGCSTPQAALDQPNYAAMLAVELDRELGDFRAQQSQFAKARVAAIHRLEAQMTVYDVETGFDARAEKMAGNDANARLMANLLELAESKAKDDAALQARLIALDASLAKLVNPPPELSAKLKATQVELATLGQELSVADRTRLVAGFARELQLEFKKAKAAQAAQSASAASASSGPANP